MSNMKVIEVPEELIVRAKQILGLEDAVNTVIKSLVDQIVKNHFEVAALWNEVNVEAAKQGIIKKDGDSFTFDYITGKFLLKSE